MRGYSLLELMVSLTLSLMLMGLLITLGVNMALAVQSHRERLLLMHHALQLEVLLKQEVAMAGYLGCMTGRADDIENNSPIDLHSMLSVKNNVLQLTYALPRSHSRAPGFFLKEDCHHGVITAVSGGLRIKSVEYVLGNNGSLYKKMAGKKFQALMEGVEEFALHSTKQIVRASVVLRVGKHRKAFNIVAHRRNVS